ncbi:MFS transporter [Patescibacteria group bacterium]|nr:MFS transporter [Patescibacteria group bacterium]
MSLLNNFHLHGFFRNKELNHFYITVAIMAFAEDLIAIFVPIYFFQLGYPVYLIIFFYFLVSLSFVIFSYPGAKLVSKIGVKHAILWSTPFLIGYYFGLRIIDSQSWLFFLLPVLLSGRMILYNYGYHLNYITHSNRKTRGRELSFFGITAAGAHIMAPLIGGVMVFYFGFSALYILSSLLLILGTLPLFLTREGYEKLKFSRQDLWKEIFSRKQRGELISFSGYAVESIIGRTIWPVFLIIILVDVYKTGLVVTLSIVISISFLYFIGRMTDTYNKIKLLKLGTFLYFFAWIGRIFADTTLKIFVIDSYKGIAEKVLHIPWAAKSYDLAMERGYFRFLVSREIIFNLSRIVVMPFLILLFYLDFYPFILSFATAALFSIGYLFLDEK